MLITLLIFQGLFATVGKQSVPITFLCIAGQVFLFAILMVLYIYRFWFFFSSSVRLVLQQLLGKQPHEVFKMLLTHSGWAHCLPWCVWGLDCKFLIWTKRRNRKDWSLVSHTLQETLLASEDCTHNTGCTSKKKEKKSFYLCKDGCSPTSRHVCLLWGEKRGHWNFRHCLI